MANLAGRVVPSERCSGPRHLYGLHRLGDCQLTQLVGADLADKSMLDDHARFAIAARACKQATTRRHLECMDEAIHLHGAPRKVIIDNGQSFIGRGHKREVLFERTSNLSASNH